MAKQSSHPDEQQLIIKMLEYEDDPLNFVLFAFPWGQPDTRTNFIGPTFSFSHTSGAGWHSRSTWNHAYPVTYPGKWYF